MAAWRPANHENPPLPPFDKGGLGGFESYLQGKSKRHGKSPVPWEEQGDAVLICVLMLIRPVKDLLYSSLRSLRSLRLGKISE